MKQWFKRIGILFLIVVVAISLFLTIAPAVFFGKWLLDLFGLIKYEPPLSQGTQSIVQVDLLDTSDQEWIVLYSIKDEELEPFVDDYMQISFGRYANDPPTWYGNRTVRICYADGGYDLHGDIVEFYSATGENLPTRGWYCIEDDDIDSIFKKWID